MNLRELWNCRGLVIKENSHKWSRVKNQRVNIVATSIQEVLNLVRNNIKYKREPKDLWQTPQETLDLGYGDCEDFVILMRAIYISNGGNPDNTALIVLFDKIVQEYHAGLIIDSPDGLLYLDNMTQYPTPVNKIDIFVPIRAYTSNTGYLYGSPY